MLTELGQYVDKDDDKDAESHEDAAPKSEDEKTDSFDAYIKSLDMDYAPYIEKNKGSESDVVTHKNSGGDFAADEHDDAANPYFTNDDQRTHTDAHLDAELDELSHTDAPFFQGNGGAPSIKTQKIEGGEGDEGWIIDEYPYPLNEWVDESDEDIVDHTNQGEWMAEEVDPSAVVHSDDADDWAEETSTKTPFDHTDVGTWSAEEIDDTPEPKVVKEHTNAGGWVEFESGHSDDVDIPDHSNDGDWHVNEVDLEYDTSAHTDKVQDGWVETDSKHDDDVKGWTEETGTAHRDSDWQEETSTVHRDSDGWQEEDSEHGDASGWQSETSGDQHYDDNVLIYAAEDFIN
ncbi:hypothetical protein BJV82DRAFT_265944 [Fennellomyces sp. T-0311]|nr:hypothetical protein BJV82DRAFT_265944 [Fennellomyces sp. T-0311]